MIFFMVVARNVHPVFADAVMLGGCPSAVAKAGALRRVSGVSACGLLESLLGPAKYPNEWLYFRTFTWG